MDSQETPERPEKTTNLFSAADVVGILKNRSWLQSDPSTEQMSWCEHAANILGPQVADRVVLADLLKLVFHYEAGEILVSVDSHIVLSRYGAREVLRHLALLLLEGTPVTTERFKEIVTKLKERLDLRGRELFHPLRLALAGRAGQGELDRVILLLDEAAALPFACPVKGTRSRILEFCAALD